MLQPWKHVSIQQRYYLMFGLGCAPSSVIGYRTDRFIRRFYFLNQWKLNLNANQYITRAYKVSILTLQSSILNIITVVENKIGENVVV